jgi:hypothetical protein
MTSTPAEHSAWTAPGASDAAQKTYASVKAALASLISRRDLDVFLQGSYANATNIRADSDVDIVVVSRRTFQGSLERLSAAARTRWEALPAATYTAAELRAEVTQALVAYYGQSRVHQHNKCIKVDKAPGYVDADVVPCFQYRWFRTADPDLSREFVEGIVIEPLRGPRIVNFPKEHIKNGQAKNNTCSERYKPTVRQMKHLRNRAVSERRLNEDSAPGYLLECMTFNAPTDRFVSNHSERLKDVVLWLKIVDKQNFWSCDGVHRLFVNDPGGFDVPTAQRIADALWDAY